MGTGSGLRRRRRWLENGHGLHSQMRTAGFGSALPTTPSWLLTAQMFGLSRRRTVFRSGRSLPSQAKTVISGLEERADWLFWKETAFEPWFRPTVTRSTASQEFRGTPVAACFWASSGVQ